MAAGVKRYCAIIFALTVYMYCNVSAANNRMSKANSRMTPRLPRAMKLDTFLSQIATGRTYEQLYFIFETSIPSFAPLLSFTATLTAESGSLVNSQVTRRFDGRIPNGPCFQQTDQLQLVDQRSQCTRAIFDTPSAFDDQPGNGSSMDMNAPVNQCTCCGSSAFGLLCLKTMFKVSMPPHKPLLFSMIKWTKHLSRNALPGSRVNRFFYFTTKPDEYFMEFVCLSVENNNCEAGFWFGLYTVRAPPNQFDWKRAVKETRRQVGLDYTDPRSLFLFRISDACPEP